MLTGDMGPDRKHCTGCMAGTGCMANDDDKVVPDCIVCGSCIARGGYMADPDRKVVKSSCVALASEGSSEHAVCECDEVDSRVK